MASRDLSPPLRSSAVVDNKGFVSKPWLAFFEALGRNAPRRTVYRSTVDPSSISAGATVLVSVATVGAALGDRAFATFTSGNSNVALHATVTAADTTVVAFRNYGGSPVDFGSGTLLTVVEKIE